MAFAQTVLADNVATALATPPSGERVKITRLTATNRNAAAVSLIILDGATEITRYHLAAAGGQINLGTGDPSMPVYPREKHSEDGVFTAQQSANQDGTIIEVEWAPQL